MNFIVIFNVCPLCYVMTTSSLLCPSCLLSSIFIHTSGKHLIKHHHVLIHRVKIQIDNTYITTLKKFKILQMLNKKGERCLVLSLCRFTSHSLTNILNRVISFDRAY